MTRDSYFDIRQLVEWRFCDALPGNEAMIAAVLTKVKALPAKPLPLLEYRKVGG